MELGFAGIDEYLRDRFVGGCAPSSGSVMVGWMDSWPGSDYDPDRRLSGTAVGVRVGGCVTNLWHTRG
jgi:hypothetical protein